MTDAELLLVDARAQIRAALEEMDSDYTFTVRGQFPRSKADGVVVTYAEITNQSTSVSVWDQLGYQIDVWAFDRDTLYALAAAANTAMLTIGFRRDYSGPDEGPYDNSGYYRKTLRFGRKVDKRTMRLID
ncbi:MAG: hypothetical protein LUH36_05895 [Oscillospiraceae bacterium]|nr:hypothetical protein [Oscillospiraceae bacterium]